MHNLDTTNGQTSFVSAREDAWHALGTTLPDTFTAEEAMERGLLGGWNVRKAPIATVLPDGTMRVKEGHFDVIRDNPVSGEVDVLSSRSTVSKSYQIVQNEEHAAFLNELVDESGAHFETAGAVDGGRHVFITLKLPGYMKVGGVDQVDNYIAAINSHDGTKSFTVMTTPIRVVCQNTLNMAFQNARNIYRVRHTKGLAAVLRAEAREALELSFNYIDGFQEEAERMINATLTEARFVELITKEFGAGKDAAPATVTRTENKLDEMHRLFVEAQTQEGLRNTVWAGLNAITEWADHWAPSRGSEDKRNLTRHNKALFYPEFKERARQMMLAEVR